MMKEIQRAIDALKEVPAEFHDLVMREVSGVGGKKRGPKPGSKRKISKAKSASKPGYTKSGAKRKKPGPKPGFKKAQVKSVVKKAIKVPKPSLKPAPTASSRASMAPVKVKSAKDVKAEKIARAKALTEQIKKEVTTED